MAVVEAADTLSLVDRLLDKLVDWLNRRKLRKVQEHIDTLHDYCERLERSEEVIRSQLALVEQRISELQDDKRFRLSDILTLGLSFASRRVLTSLRELVLENTKEKCERQVRQMQSRSESIKTKISELERQLAYLQTQRNPSFIAKIIRFFQLLKHLVSAILNLVAGKFLQVISAVHSLYESVSAIRGRSPLRLSDDSASKNEGVRAIEGATSLSFATCKRCGTFFFRDPDEITIREYLCPTCSEASHFSTPIGKSLYFGSRLGPLLRCSKCGSFYFADPEARDSYNSFCASCRKKQLY